MSFFLEFFRRTPDSPYYKIDMNHSTVLGS